MIESMIQLVCTHCSHRFELEKQEGALCPSCGWSSTVIPVSELENQTKKSVPQKATTHSLAGLRIFLFLRLKF